MVAEPCQGVHSRFGVKSLIRHTGRYIDDRHYWASVCLSRNVDHVASEADLDRRRGDAIKAGSREQFQLSIVANACGCSITTVKEKLMAFRTSQK